MSDGHDMHLNANVLGMLNEGAIDRVYQEWLVEFNVLEGAAHREAWDTAVDGLLEYLDTEDGAKSRYGVETLIGRILHECLETTRRPVPFWGRPNGQASQGSARAFEFGSRRSRELEPLC